MHRRALTCRLCQQQFFPASLKFHLKVCAKRQEHVELPCDHCDERYLSTMLKAHMKFCEQRKRRARATESTGLRSPDATKTPRQGGVGGTETDTPSSTAESGAGRQQHSLRKPQASPEHAQNPPLQAQSQDIAKSAPRQRLGGNRDNNISCSECPGDDIGRDGNRGVRVAASDGRIACTNCQRRFSSDRVGVHQNICKRVNPPSARHASQRGKDKKTCRSKRAKLAPSRGESRRRQMSRPVVSALHAAARTRGARGRSVGAHRRNIEGHFAVDGDRDRKSFGSDDRPWRESAPTQVRVDTTATPGAPPPAIPLSAGAEYRGSSFSSSLGQEGSRTAQTERQHLQREIQHHLRREEGSDSHRRARRPFSAADLVSPPEDMVPLTPVEGSGTSVSVGRAVSMSCSPVRRRSSIGTTAAAYVRLAERNERDARRSGSVVSTGGCRFVGCGGSEGDFVRSSNVRRRGSADRRVGSERLAGGTGFFSPSRDGGRVRWLK